MNARFAALHVRRTASWKTTSATVGTIVVAAYARGPAGAPVSDEIAYDQTRALWSLALVLLGGIALWRGASIPDRWFAREGAWLGASPLSRLRIATSALLGTVAGLFFLIALATVAIALCSRSPDRPVELAVVAGPEQSVLLLEGESFEQSLETNEVRLPPGALVRVRVTPTLGGVGPTTFVRAGAGGPALERSVARRTWIEVPNHAGIVALENVGSGALAVLGPRPVEVWRPSSALLGGHARAGAHAAALLCVLVSLALGAGAWMGQGIAAMLAFSLWIGIGLPGALPEGIARRIPGATGLGRVLDAIGEGHVPAQPSLLSGGVAVAALVAAVLVATPALRTWHREDRG